MEKRGSGPKSQKTWKKKRRKTEEEGKGNVLGTSSEPSTLHALADFYPHHNPVRMVLLVHCR